MTTPLTGRAAVLRAFDRLFDRATEKLHFECSEAERAEVTRAFTERYDDALQMLDQAEFPAIPDAALVDMEQAIDELSPATIAAHLATGPLALHVQHHMRRVARRAAEQRVLEHLASRADDAYGGN
jgi:hypothetical protein